MLLVTAALPYLLCGMGSTGTSAQVFPTPDSQDWGGEGGGKERGEGGRGEREKEEKGKENTLQMMI